MAASGASPVSSPRLPSPPPIAEDQLGPKSPSPASDEQQKLFSLLDHGASRRIRPGTKAEDMAEGPPLVDLSEIDSAFQLTEHLKALHYSLTHPDGSNSTVAIDREMAHRLAHPPENVDRTLWLYELCRFLTQKVNSIIIALFSDNPACSSITCPEMRASEWQYLCAVHDPPKSCCAIDYCCHTLDWAANTLTSPKNFPSRLAMGTDSTIAGQQVRNLTNIFRRVYRIFAHAWFQHQEMFWKIEGRSGLYILFKTVCDVYGLIQEDNYTIPPEAEGNEHSEETSMPTPLIMKRDPTEPGSMDNTSVLEMGDHTLSTAGTTKRHRHSPSVSATPVTTVVEESEEDEETLDAPSTVQSVSHEEAAPTELAKFAGDSSSEEDHESKEGTVLIAAENTRQTDEAEKQEPSASSEEQPPADKPVPEIPTTAAVEEEGPGAASEESAAVRSEEKSGEHGDEGHEDKPAAPVAEASNAEVEETETSSTPAEPEKTEKAKADVDADGPAALDADKDKAEEAATASG